MSNNFTENWLTLHRSNEEKKKMEKNISAFTFYFEMLKNVQSVLTPILDEMSKNASNTEPMDKNDKYQAREKFSGMLWAAVRNAGIDK